MSGRSSWEDLPALETMSFSGRWRSALFWLILLLPALISIYLEASPFKIVEYPGHFGHSLVEGFCGLMAIIVGFTVWRESAKTGSCALLVLSFGFTAMGILDLFHALSPPGSDEFVWLHSTSVLSGSLGFVSAAALASHPRRCRPAIARTGMGVLWLAVAAFGVLSLVFPGLVPPMRAEGQFTWTAKGLNYLAGAFLGIAGVAEWRRARAEQNLLHYVYALSLFLFAESAWIFGLSRLWDSSWWLWHFVKVLVFLAIIVCGAYSVSEAFHEVKESRATLEQAYHQLKAAQKSLVESEKLAALGTAAASVAHEIRNPLGVLNNAIGGLQRCEVLSEDDRELLDLMEAEVDRLNEIVTEFLRFARPRPLAVQRAHLPALVKEVIKEVERAAPQDVPIKIISRLDNNLPVCSLDPAQMKHALLNLLTNAVQALPRGGTICVEGAHRDGAADIRVTDTGEGISDEVLAKVFSPFFTTKADGTGLGLTIARRIVRAHGGDISISSHEGRGTTVVLTLPAPGARQSG